MNNNFYFHADKIISVEISYVFLPVDIVSGCLCSLLQAYWAGGLHLFTPLPFNPGKGGIGDLFKTHIFINAGNLGNVYLGKTDICS
jgi:hypothetical protein